MAGWLLDNVLGYVGYVKTLLHTKANVGALLCAALQSPGSVSRRALAHSKLKKKKRKKTFGEEKTSQLSHSLD